MATEYAKREYCWREALHKTAEYVDPTLRSIGTSQDSVVSVEQELDETVIKKVIAHLDKLPAIEARLRMEGLSTTLYEHLCATIRADVFGTNNKKDADHARVLLDHL